MERFLVEILRLVPAEVLGNAGDKGRYVTTGHTEEVEAANEWEAGRKFFARLGVVSLPTPAFALRIRRLPPLHLAA